MSSLDGIGRYYPLTLFACATRAMLLRRPISMLTINGSRLSKTFCSQRSTTRLPSKDHRMRLNNSRHRPTNQRDSQPEGLSILKNGIVAGPLGNRSFSDLFALLRTANHSSLYAAASFWWTVGGRDFDPFGFCCQRYA